VTEPRARVWVVDDSPNSAEIARRALADHYDVEVFLEGATALERMSVAVPHLLVLDWHMPEISGLEVCRFVREKHEASQLPILIVTAASEPSDLVLAFEAGANDFVRKPFDAAELDARVQGLERSRHLFAQLDAAEALLRDEAVFRERFIAALGHDLRQPLSAISALAATMTRERDADPRAHRIAQASQRMARMLDDLLDVSRSRLGAGISLRRSSVSLEAVVEGVVEEIRGAHPDRSIETHCSGDLHGQWDEGRIAQVFSNLLDNAIKHGAHASPVVVTLEGRDRECIGSVRNEGSIIPERSRATLFDAFRQGSPTAATKGLGLGLFIADQIVKAHGGTLTAESRAEATTFTLVLPRRAD
jgi:signal transduction histidine kinase